MKQPSLAHLLISSAQRFPAHPVVHDDGVTTTYQQLYHRAQALATLLDAQGIGPGDRVGILLDKGATATAALFAVLGVGAAYVPLDPSSPTQRLRTILEDCSLRALLTIVSGAESLLAPTPPMGLELVVAVDAPDLDAPDPDAPDSDGASPEGAGPRTLHFSSASLPDLATTRDLDRVDDPSTLAMVLYTSGSTGRPKGVMISHRAALAFVGWSVDTLGLTHDDRVAAVAALHFDLSIFDHFATVAQGACLLPLPSWGLLKPSETRRWIAQEGITTWYSTPSMLRLLLDQGALEQHPPPGLRRVLFAGEVFPTPPLRRLRAALPGVELYNLYGPTETNVCTFHRVDTVPKDDQQTLPIGRACAGTEVLVLDNQRQPTDDGVEGELWVRGPTLMDGYWKAPEATARVLLPRLDCASGSSASGPWLRTGDLAHRDAAGVLHFHGRRDHLVKVRGYRVELGEVEAALNTHPGVAEAVVVPFQISDPPETKLRAWVAPRSATPQDTESRLSMLALKVHLGKRLPPYMIPAEIRSLPDLPKTSTGKIDRQALAGFNP